MKNAVCVFDLLNDSQEEMLLYLEPEGAEFRLPPGKAVKVYLYGGENPIEMKHSADATGKKTVSFWPASGSFELVFEGSNVWDQI